MGRRIEVELTSARDDGTWTWRAAGAKQPKGVVDAALLYEGASVGDVVRADAEFDLDGILITAVLPPKDKKRPEPVRLEIIGPPRPHEGVTSSLVPKSDRPRPDRGRRDDGGPPRERGRRDAGGAPRDHRGAPGRPRDEGVGGRAGEGDRERRGGPRPAPAGAPRRSGPPRGDTASRAAGRPRREGDGADRPRPPRPVEADPPRPRRLAPANVHRAAVLEALLPEQRPIAEQVLRGGIPAVRQAVEAQNASLRSEGRPEIHAEPLLAIAEELLPVLKAADWRDRAEAAAKTLDEISLRDLRSVVAGADAARDDEARLLAGTLRQALERRLAEQRDRWLADITTALDEGRLVRALRLSARPPDTATRFPAELAVRMSEAAGAAMAPDASAERWTTLLEAVAESPVRRSVKPTGLPPEPGQELLNAARQASGRIPALAPMLGISMPPPPGPPRPLRAGPRGPRPHAPAARRPGPPPPPPPPPAAAPAQQATAPAPVDPTGPVPPAEPPSTPPHAAPAPPESGQGVLVDERGPSDDG